MESFHIHRGFTLIEMMVVITIITIVSAVVIVNQGSFNRSIILSNAAYDVALTLRSAETYGLGTRAIGSTFNVGYGIDFKKASPSTFTLFADTYPLPSTDPAQVCHPTADITFPSSLSGNCVYDSAQGEKVTDYTLEKGITIADFCAFNGTWSCANSNGSSLTLLDIVFSRPNADPFMSVNGAYSSGSAPTQACLKLVSPQGGARYVAISASGGITANAASCP
jgi:prepilin-type N-terminal cleavage/methylation domain-containing protein